MFGTRSGIHSSVEQEGLHILQGFGKIDETPLAMYLSEEDFQKGLKIMMWDLYEKINSEVQKGLRGVLKAYEDEGKIAEGVMTAIVFLNVQERILEGYELGVSDDAEAVWELPLELPGFDLIEYRDLYHQMNAYKNSGKIVPPNLLTMGNLDNARQEGKDAVRTVLNAYNI